MWPMKTTTTQTTWVAKKTKIFLLSLKALTCTMVQWLCDAHLPVLVHCLVQPLAATVAEMHHQILL
jgi:hypothetical protein